MSQTNGIGDLNQALRSISPVSPSGTQQLSMTKSNGNNPAAPREGDETRLSTTSGLIAQALEGSDVRTEKVAALQESIANGSYNVSSADVADKMIRSLLG
jgi:negative regulator of flagellin synthesis FlgM